MFTTLVTLFGASVLAVKAAPHAHSDSHAPSYVSTSDDASVFALSAPRFTQCPTSSSMSLNTSTIAQVSNMNSTTASTLYCYYNPEAAHTCAYNAYSGDIVSGAGTGCLEISKGCYTTCTFKTMKGSKKSSDKRTFGQVAVSSGADETACFINGANGQDYQCVYSAITGNFTTARGTQNASLCDSVMVEQGPMCLTLN